MLNFGIFAVDFEMFFFHFLAKKYFKVAAKIPKFSIFLHSLIYEKIQSLIIKLKFGSDMPLTYRDLHTKF